jgi:hypothetical protein
MLLESFSSNRHLVEIKYALFRIFRDVAVLRLYIFVMNISQQNVSLSDKLRLFKYLELDEVFGYSILERIPLNFQPLK